MLPLQPFKLERYFAQYEFSVRYLLSSSDCESVTQAELVNMADPASRALWENLWLGYTESPGHPELRAEIARTYQHISAEQIVVAAPEELIFIAMHSLLRAGDHVVCVAPAYQSLYEVARAIGCEVDLLYLHTGESGWQLDVEAVRGKIKPNTRLLILNFPHNPTGHLISPAEQAALVELARAHSLYVFSDEMYRGLELNPGARLPAFADIYERAVSLSGLSKAHGLPGLRVGWLATPAAEVPARWLALKDYTTICNSAPSEALALIALRAAEKLIARNLSLVRANVATAEQLFARYPQHVRWIAPVGGSIAFAQWLSPEPLNNFCERALQERGVMIVPGEIFDYAGPYFRVGLGRKNLPEVLREVEALFQSTAAH